MHIVIHLYQAPNLFWWWPSTVFEVPYTAGPSELWRMKHTITDQHILNTKYINELLPAAATPLPQPHTHTHTHTLTHIS
jgi:hypothetical protein